MSNLKKNDNLNTAKTSQKDEFYTLISDIEKELLRYKNHFENKVVYCNCDDPRVSKFFQFFSFNFEKYKLKKLITTCYKNQNVDLFTNKDSEKSICLEYYGDKNGNRVPDLEEIGIKYLQGDGDFRSKESIELLIESDIVVTNPPFSLFREYINQLIEYDKKFVVIGSLNALTTKEIFKLIKEDKIWLGYNLVKKFEIPEYYEHNSITYQDGVRFAVFGNICWYTNLDIEKRYNDFLIPYKTYYGNEKEYPEYDNFNCIEVPKISLIPMDYEGVMGVPVTFLDKYNPNQFEIIGADYDVKLGLLPELSKQDWTGKIDRAYLNGKRLYSRLFIKYKLKQNEN